jgi:hypothetical protein
MATQRRTSASSKQIFQHLSDDEGILFNALIYFYSMIRKMVKFKKNRKNVPFFIMGSLCYLQEKMIFYIGRKYNGNGFAEKYVMDFC